MSLKTSAQAESPPLMQEYKAKLRNEYLSLGGSPNTVR